MMLRKNYLHLVIALGIAMFIAIAPAVAQDHSALVGKWNMTSDTDNDSVRWILVLKDSDGKLAASLATEDGEAPAKGFSYEGGVLKFKAPYQGQDYDIELKVSAAGLEGTWSGGGGSGKTRGVKAS